MTHAAFRGVPALAAIAVLGAGAPGCAPSIDQAAKASVDGQIAALRATAQAFPPPSAPQPSPFRVGQWTQHKMVDEKGRPSLLTYKIVGQDGDAFWMESVSESYFGRTVTKILMTAGDRVNLDTIDIRAVRTKDKNGKITDFDAQTLVFMKGIWRQGLQMLVISWSGMPQEDATAAAGTFAGCYKTHTDVAFGPYRAESLSWSHPAVPISGLVRSQGVNRNVTMELVAFGETGATSEM